MLCLTHLQRVRRHVRLRDDPKDLHPLAEHLGHSHDFCTNTILLYLLGDEVQGQDVLGEGEVDLEDLLLDGHGQLGLVRH